MLSSCFFFKASGASAIHFLGSSVAAPHQPERSLPLNNAVKPGGASAERTAAAVTISAATMEIFFNEVGSFVFIWGLVVAKTCWRKATGSGNHCQALLLPQLPGHTPHFAGCACHLRSPSPPLPTRHQCARL